MGGRKQQQQEDTERKFTLTEQVFSSSPGYYSFSSPSPSLFPPHLEPLYAFPRVCERRERERENPFSMLQIERKSQSASTLPNAHSWKWNLLPYNNRI